MDSAGANNRVYVFGKLLSDETKEIVKQSLVNVLWPKLNVTIQNNYQNDTVFLYGAIRISYTNVRNMRRRRLQVDQTGDMTLQIGTFGPNDGAEIVNHLKEGEFSSDSSTKTFDEQWTDEATRLAGSTVIIGSYSVGLNGAFAAVPTSTPTMPQAMNTSSDDDDLSVGWIILIVILCLLCCCLCCWYFWFFLGGKEEQKESEVQMGFFSSTTVSNLKKNS